MAAVFSAPIKPTTFANWLQMRRKLRDEKVTAPGDGLWLLTKRLRAHQSQPIYNRLHRVLTQLKVKRLFIGDAEAGERSAILYTIVECCRRRGLDPYAYLHHVLTRLPTATNWQIKDLTPEAWARDQQYDALFQAA